MKLIVTIPAYNEEKSIAKVIKEIPREIERIDRVEILVIDDGSIDRTKEIAKEAGADYVLSNPSNQGLAYSFKKGLEKALELKADIIVNIDADLQYNAQEIPKLIQPILDGKAEMVIGNRQVRKLAHMKFAKKYGNILLSWTMRKALKNKVSDASSGFRAFSGECASKLNIFSNHTYTHETIIQCTFQNMRIGEVPVEFRKREEGPSRLIKSIWGYVKLSGATTVRVCLMYKPLKVFVPLSLLIFTAAIALAVISILFTDKFLDTTFIILCTTALQTFFFGLLAEIIVRNKK